MHLTPSSTNSTDGRHLSTSRVLYLDVLRTLACFLVVVNHTNSLVFQAESPGSLTWFFSILWYYLSKIAVPLFVMIAGANLLPKQDSYSRIGVRILRVVLVLVLFSYGYYLWNLWLTHLTWQRALDIPAFLHSIWQAPITDSFWYLYLYIGLLVMLPLLQRMAYVMKKKDMLYLTGISLGIGSFWSLLTHYLPSLAPSPYFDLPLFSIFIGLFFAGHFLQHYAQPKPQHRWLCVAIIIGSLLFSLLITLFEANRISLGQKYWFMDERTAPAFPIITCALAFMHLAHCLDLQKEPSNGKIPSRAHLLFSRLGRYTFAIYLIQDFLIAETRYRLFVPLSATINPWLAALAWEGLIFAAALLIAWLLLLIPWFRKIL